MKKEIMSMPWMAKNAKKKNAYNVCAKMVGDQLVIDFSDKKPFMRTVLTQKSFENFFPNERIIKKSYYDEETVFGTNKKSITSILLVSVMPCLMRSFRYARYSCDSMQGIYRDLLLHHSSGVPSSLICIQFCASGQSK